MNISVRLFAGYFLIVGLAAWFLVGIFAKEVEPGVRQATEETLVDSANLLAELAAPELAAGHISDGAFAAAVARATRRDPGARIWGFEKHSVDIRIYVTDASGVVRFDSARRDLGVDYSQWNDVARVLRGQYGARATRLVIDDPNSSTMHVAAPVMQQGQLIGVLTIAKPMAALLPYAERARDRVMRAGLLLLGISLLIGIGFTLWLTWSLNRLRDYALAVAAGQTVTPPTLGGRQLAILARSLALMREKLDGKQYVETYVQSLTHELKSPLTAMRGAAELLEERPPAEQAGRFAHSIVEQAARMQRIIDRLLALARIEQLQSPEAKQALAIGELVAAAIAERRAHLETRELRVTVCGDTSISVHGDPFLLQQAVGNLLDNAAEFSPGDGHIDVTIAAFADHVELTVCDQGPGAPDYALPHLFERFYSLPRPATGQKSTGLGLPFVREVARLHGGSVDFANRPTGGAQVTLRLRR